MHPFLVIPFCCCCCYRNLPLNVHFPLIFLCPVLFRRRGRGRRTGLRRRSPGARSSSRPPRRRSATYTAPAGEKRDVPPGSPMSRSFSKTVVRSVSVSWRQGKSRRAESRNARELKALHFLRWGAVGGKCCFTPPALDKGEEHAVANGRSNERAPPSRGCTTVEASLKVF